MRSFNVARAVICNFSIRKNEENSVQFRNPFFNRLKFHFCTKNRENQINKWQYLQPTKPAQLYVICKSMNFTDQWQHNFLLFSPLGACVQSSAGNNNNTCGAILILFTINKNEFHRPEIIGHCCDYMECDLVGFIGLFPSILSIFRTKYTWRWKINEYILMVTQD